MINDDFTSSKAGKKRIDVIVATKDDGEGLEKTLRSIGIQKTKAEVETIVVESWENQGEAVKRILNQPPKTSKRIRAVRQWPPQGIYAALNKGMEESRGDLIVFMNAGDTFAEDTSCNELLEHYLGIASREKTEGPACVFGKARVSAYGGCIRWQTPLGVGKMEVRQWLKWCWPCHQAFMFNGEWARNNPYQIDGLLSADAEIMRKAIDNPEAQYLEKTVAVYNLDGASSRPPTIKVAYNTIKRTQGVSKMIGITSKLIMSPVWWIYPLALLIKMSSLAFAAKLISSMVSYSRKRKRTVKDILI